jgi:hypothetical protein
MLSFAFENTQPGQRWEIGFGDTEKRENSVGSGAEERLKNLQGKLQSGEVKNKLQPTQHVAVEQKNAITWTIRMPPGAHFWIQPQNPDGTRSYLQFIGFENSAVAMGNYDYNGFHVARNANGTLTVYSKTPFKWQVDQFDGRAWKFVQNGTSQDRPATKPQPKPQPQPEKPRPSVDSDERPQDPPKKNNDILDVKDPLNIDAKAEAKNIEQAINTTILRLHQLEKIYGIHASIGGGALSGIGGKYFVGLGVSASEDKGRSLTREHFYTFAEALQANLRAAGYTGIEIGTNEFGYHYLRGELDEASVAAVIRFGQIFEEVCQSVLRSQR